MAASFRKLIISLEETVLELKNLLKSMFCDGFFMGLRGIPVPIFITWSNLRLFIALSIKLFTGAVISFT